MLGTGLFKTLRRGEMGGFCANTTGSYGFLKLLKICHIIYNDVQTRVSLSLAHTHTHTHTHNDYHLLEVNCPVLYTARDFTTPLSSSYFCDFRQSGPDYFSAKFLIFRAQKAATVLPERRENIIKRCKRMCRFELEFGPGAAESGVDFTRHWK